MLERGTFGGAYSMNVSMNIVDRSAFYREIHRVFKPGGWPAHSEIEKGEGVGDTVMGDSLADADADADADPLLAARLVRVSLDDIAPTTTQVAFHATTSPADDGRAFHHRTRARAVHCQAQHSPFHSQNGAHHHE